VDVNSDTRKFEMAISSKIYYYGMSAIIGDKGEPIGPKFVYKTYD